MAALTSKGSVSTCRALLEASLEDGSSAAACVHTAALLLKAGDCAAAKQHYERALDADPSSRQAHAGLYYAFTGMGDRHSAAIHLGHALQLQAIVALPWRGTGTPVSVLLLQSINAGNVLIQRFLDNRVFEAHILLVEFYQDGMPLPPHQVVINAIGDADVRVDALAVAQSVLAKTDAPVINPPATVLATGRCENARRLAEISGVVTPLALAFPRQSLASGDAAAMLATDGLEFPLLIRAPGYHMGQHFLEVEDSSGLAAALTELPGEELIVMQYLNSRGVDGKARKYRVLTIDGQLYPVHLAISSHWKVHYFSAEMAENPEYRAEEEEFLNDMAGALGRETMAALERIQAALGLDYGGIDFGLNERGEILLFEANATMAVYRPDANTQWDYRRAAIERIYEAVHRLLIARARAAIV